MFQGSVFAVTTVVQLKYRSSYRSATLPQASEKVITKLILGDPTAPLHIHWLKNMSLPRGRQRERILICCHEINLALHCLTSKSPLLNSWPGSSGERDVLLLERSAWTRSKDGRTGKAGVSPRASTRSVRSSLEGKNRILKPGLYFSTLSGLRGQHQSCKSYFLRSPNLTSPDLTLGHVCQLTHGAGRHSNPSLSNITIGLEVTLKRACGAFVSVLSP